MQKVYLNRDRAGGKSWKFWNPAAKLNGDFQPKWIAHVMWRVHDRVVRKDFEHGSSLGSR